MIFSAALSMLLTGPTIPANGWLDRVEAACPTYKCTLSVLTDNKRRGAACTVDLRENPAEKGGALQGLSADLFGWDEYISATGDTCVHMTSPENTWLSADEADLFLGVMRVSSPGRPNQLTSPELPKRRRDYKYKAKFARLRSFDIVSVGPPPTAQNPMRAFTLKVFAEMDSRRARSTKTNLVWVDYDMETLLSTQATLTLIAKKPLLPITKICVGRKVSGPFGACIEYTVSTNKDGEYVFDSFER